MPSVTIDSAILALPGPSVEQADVCAYAEALADWSSLCGQQGLDVLMSERAMDVLYTASSYPSVSELQHLLSTRNLHKRYTARDIFACADRLLQSAPTFERRFELRDVLYESLDTEPDLLSPCVNQAFRDDLGRCIVLAALLRNRCRLGPTDHSLAARQAPFDGVARVRAVINHVEHSRGDLEDLPSPPEPFEGSVQLCRSAEQLRQAVDPVAIWQSSTDGQFMRAAVHFAWYQSRHRRGLNTEWDEIPFYRVGKQFLKSVIELHLVDATVAAALRSTVETLDDLNLKDTHPLRENESGGSPQQTRGADKAWRRDIDYVYHLHYWRGPRGSTELASMVMHNDFTIPE